MSQKLSLVKKLIALGIALDVIIADQISKWGVTELLLRPKASDDNPVGLIVWLAKAPERIPPVQLEMTPFFNLVMVWNQGVSFGLFNHDSNTGVMLLLALASVITLIFLVWLFHTASMFQATSIALVIGGAVGNAIDRARFGAVIDFLDFHAAGIHWPAFNIADSAIVIGVSLLILHSLLLEKKEQK
jgi:signal peptidase II